MGIPSPSIFGFIPFPRFLKTLYSTMMKLLDNAVGRFTNVRKCASQPRRGIFVVILLSFGLAVCTACQDMNGHSLKRGNYVRYNKVVFEVKSALYMPNVSGRGGNYLLTLKGQSAPKGYVNPRHCVYDKKANRPTTNMGYALPSRNGRRLSSAQLGETNRPDEATGTRDASH